MIVQKSPSFAYCLNIWETVMIVLIHFSAYSNICISFAFVLVDHFSYFGLFSWCLLDVINFFLIFAVCFCISINIIGFGFETQLGYLDSDLFLAFMIW